MRRFWQRMDANQLATKNILYECGGNGTIAFGRIVGVIVNVAHFWADGVFAPAKSKQIVKKLVEAIYPGEAYAVRGGLYG